MKIVTVVFFFAQRLVIYPFMRKKKDNDMWYNYNFRNGIKIGDERTSNFNSESLDVRVHFNYLYFDLKYSHE